MLIPDGAPPRLSVDRRFGGSSCGNDVLWLRAGGLTDGRHREVAVGILATPSLGTDAWVLRADRGGLRVLRRFHADRVTAVDHEGRPELALSWIYQGLSSDGRTVEQVWRFERGAYRLWRRR